MVESWSLAFGLALMAGTAAAHAQTVVTRQITQEPVETTIMRGPNGTVVTRRPLDLAAPQGVAPGYPAPGYAAPGYVATGYVAPAYGRLMSRPAMASSRCGLRPPPS